MFLFLTNGQFGRHDVTQWKNILWYAGVAVLAYWTRPHYQNVFAIEVELVVPTEHPRFGDSGNVQPEFVVNVVAVAQNRDLFGHWFAMTHLRVGVEFEENQHST
jgi:hypothetical protein